MYKSRAFVDRNFRMRDSRCFYLWRVCEYVFCGKERRHTQDESINL